MEEWQERRMELAVEDFERKREFLQRTLDRDIDATYKVCQLKRKIIPNLRAEPGTMFSNTTTLFIKTDNPLLVHDVARTLGITLEKEAQSDGFNYKGEYKGIRVVVYGAQEAFGCKIVVKEVMEKRKVYVTECG